MSLKSWFLWHGELFLGRIYAKIFGPPGSSAVLVIEDSKLLALDVGDYLMLPGGVKKKQESFEEAAVREVKEETGYQIALEKKLVENINDVGGPQHIFTGKLVSENTDGGNWEGENTWVPLDKVGGKKWRFNRDVEKLVEKARKQS